MWHACGRKEMHIRVFLLENLKRRNNGRPRENNIKMDLRKIVWEVVHWMHLAQDRDQWGAIVNT
jgi:hypothetical protein